MRLRLYDLWNDPHRLTSLHENRLDLTRKYTNFLERQLEARLELGRHLTRGEDSPLSTDQLETLRSLV